VLSPPVETLPCLNMVINSNSDNDSLSRAEVSPVQCEDCPDNRSPSPPLIPAIKLKDNAQHPRLAVISESEVIPESSRVVEDSKWGWMKDEEVLSGRTKYRLSMYW